MTFQTLGLSPPETRSNPSPEQPSFDLRWLWENIDTSGIAVTETSVKQIASVAASIRLITSSLCSLPMDVYEVATQRKAPEHPASRLISREPNDEQTVSQLLTVLVESALLHGGGFIQITRTSGVVSGLWHLSSNSVTPRRLSGGALVYDTNVNGKPQVLKPFQDVVVITGSVSLHDGISPVSPLVQSREVFARALAMSRFQQKFFTNYATPSGVLSTDQKIRPEQKVEMRKDWENLHGGQSAHRVAVIDQNLKFTPITSSLRDNDVTSLSAFAENQCAAVFGLDVAMLGNSTASATNASLTETNLQFLRYVLGPWLKRIEESLTRSLCDERHEIRFDSHRLLRMNPEAQATIASLLRQSGLIRTSEGRFIGAGLPPLGTEDDDLVTAQVNLTALNNLRNNVNKGTINEQGTP